MPERIQQRRTKGWRKPENTVSVARPSMWGNPYAIKAVKRRGPFDIWVGDWFIGQATDEPRAREIAVERFRNALVNGIHGLHPESLVDLRGKNLMCFCPLDQPCHADVLLELANAPEAAGHER